VEAGWEAQQVVLRVARGADRSDIPAMVSHFRENAVLEVGERTVEGREAIFQFFGGGTPSTSPTERTKHVITNTIVAPDGDELMVTSYFQVLRSWGIANWGRYEDRLVATSGTWQIVNRKVFVDGQIARPAPPADAASSH
jgi:3-phenylpropionate/cinnamic acid dioxygenase small subunit